MRVLAIFNVNGSEYLIIAVAALIVLGPEQLPSALRRFGSALRQFREISDKMRTEFVAGINELDPTTWQGKGTDDDPIIPRFCQQASEPRWSNGPDPYRVAWRTSHT